MQNSEFSYPKMYLYRRIVEAKLFMDGHYSEAIDLDRISDEACFSKYHFLRLFKESFGQSPHQYLTELRISKAKELLKKGFPVKRVCFEVGFDSIPSFTKLFKKHIGVSPKDFKIDKQRQAELIKNRPFTFIPSCFSETYHWKE